MPGLTKRVADSGPIERLSTSLRCASPDASLTPEQLFALHQFGHTVLAAAYALYQVVPPRLANPIIEAKFRDALPESG